MDLLVPAEISCPWCGDVYETMIDTSQDATSQIEDCATCCKPIELAIQCAPGEILFLEAERG